MKCCLSCPEKTSYQVCFNQVLVLCKQTPFCLQNDHLSFHDATLIEETHVQSAQMLYADSTACC